MRGLFILLLVFTLAGCATTGTHLSILDNDKSPDEAQAPDTLRAKIANIGSVGFLYASHPVDYLNLGDRTVTILTDGYWFGRVNKELHNICEASGGKTIAKVADSFTGQALQKAADYQSTYWVCAGGKHEFVVDTLVTGARSQAQVAKSHNKLFVNVTGTVAEPPALTKNQLKTIGNDKDKPLIEFLESRFGLIFGKATSHPRKQDDGAYYQQYVQEHGKVTDISKDLGVIYDLNAYCAYHGGNFVFVDNFTLSKIVRTFIPDNQIMQCTSATNPFFVKFQVHRQFRNKYGELKTAYSIIAKEGVVDQSHLLPGHYINHQEIINDENRGIDEFLKQNFERKE
jgi:hypothetical protein